MHKEGEEKTLELGAIDDAVREMAVPDFKASYEFKVATIAVLNDFLQVNPVQKRASRCKEEEVSVR